jgi:hypothetical protein
MTTVLNFERINGVQNTTFRLAATSPAASSVVLVNNSGGLTVQDATTASSAVTASQFNATSNTGLVINSGAAESGASWKFTLSRPAAGMTADTPWVVPVNNGSPGNVLMTDGAGNLSWANSAAGATDVTHSTALAFNSTTPVMMFTLPANAVILEVEIVVDTAFDGSGPTPSVSIGIGGNLSKYMGSNDSDLTTAAGWAVFPNLPPDGSSEALQATFTAGGGATVGSARILVSYCIPL